MNMTTAALIYAAGCAAGGLAVWLRIRGRNKRDLAKAFVLGLNAAASKLGHSKEELADALFGVIGNGRFSVRVDEETGDMILHEEEKVS